MDNYKLGLQAGTFPVNKISIAKMIVNVTDIPLKESMTLVETLAKGEEIEIEINPKNTENINSIVSDFSQAGMNIRVTEPFKPVDKYLLEKTIKEVTQDGLNNIALLKGGGELLYDLKYGTVILIENASLYKMVIHELVNKGIKSITPEELLKIQEKKDKKTSN